MKIEIRFRGKTNNGEWIIGQGFHNGRDGRCQIKPLGVTNWYEVIPLSVGQFTGLKDKNGTEIFEGDVLSNSFMDSKPNKNGIVVFRNHSFCIECEDMFRPFGDSFGWANIHNVHWYGEIEVIGNIHDK